MVPLRWLLLLLLWRGSIRRTLRHHRHWRWRWRWRMRGRRPIATNPKPANHLRKLSHPTSASSARPLAVPSTPIGVRSNTNPSSRKRNSRYPLRMRLRSRSRSRNGRYKHPRLHPRRANNPNSGLLPILITLRLYTSRPRTNTPRTSKPATLDALPVLSIPSARTGSSKPVLVFVPVLVGFII